MKYKKKLKKILIFLKMINEKHYKFNNFLIIVKEKLIVNVNHQRVKMIKMKIDLRVNYVTNIIIIHV